MWVRWQTFAARLLGLLIFVSVLASPCRAGPQDMLTLMQRITALAKEGRYGEAVGLARKLVAESEKSSGRSRR
ncbi:hypothetical protein NLM27_06080 [Bradyrhizobium sp. CCGB12]|uniref:hypothetical protein n=1 Tax=Bradyrhizobium sp. CCGB12 TaxID=2949632 RepID=UPI0020B1A403|nr:hypothetical protein [Bradyrhizobium sp. CCGB12]MCP3388349.1 hypothetical protein [Bradyrhizobium sp. CCGB12]